MSAAGTLVAMTAERGRATSCDGQQHFAVLPGHPLATAFEEGLPREANQVGHLQERPVHLGRSLRRRFSFPDDNASASKGLAVALRWRLERCR